MQLTVVVVFLNEEGFLPRLLDSVERQTRLPDRLILVDDGSTDASPEIASRFAAGHGYATALELPRRESESDRLATASELRAFQQAVDQLEEPFDVVAKLDADLELSPDLFETMTAAFEDDPKLGIAGASLSVLGSDGSVQREWSGSWHVRGATKFYRRDCYAKLAPLPPILGWDTIDEARARMHGWRVECLQLPAGDPVHLRATGSYNGQLRGFRRRGLAAWGYGAHPLQVFASAALRMRHRPRVLGGLAYLGGWSTAALRRAPRAEPEVVHFVRRDQLDRLRRHVRGGAG